MAIHSFYVIAWDTGQPLYHRTWVEVSDSPTLLSGLLASLELLALKITQQHVNVVTMRDFRFLFKVDDINGLLLVFITDTTEDPSRFADYLDMLHTRFLETFEDTKFKGPIFERNPRKAKVFDELVDSLISHWETGEVSLRSVKVMDVLDVYTRFFNVTMQKVLSARSLEMYFPDLERIFRTHLKADSALRKITFDKHGIVSYDEVNPDQVKIDTLIDTLHIILKELIAIARRTRRRETYEALFFQYYVPIIKAEEERIKEYDLMKKLVMELL